MARKPRVPSYRLHRPSGQAIVVFRKKFFYLGKYGSPESRAEYRRLIAEWLANHQRLPSEPNDAARSPILPNHVLTVEELIAAYWGHSKLYYLKNNQPTSEQDTIRQALRFVRILYASTPAADFGPLALKAVREEMIRHPVTRKFKVKDPTTGRVREEVRVMKNGLARTYINKQISRIKRMFSWAVENELLPVSVSQALATVSGLRKDKSTAREKKPVKPIADDLVEAVLPLVPPVIRTMIQVQRLCGGRPQDMVEMRPGDIDRSTPVWEYRPGRHKGEHRERERIVYFGPRSQALLQDFLEGIGPEEFVFSPRRSEAARLAALRKAKGLPPGRPERTRGKWALRDQYDVASYRRAIRRACRKAGIPIWFPLQLRHTAGTVIRKLYGLEGSQAVLGHAELGVTQIYAEVDKERARRIAAEIG